MGEAREFPNPYADFDSRSDLTADGFETDFLSRLTDVRADLLKRLEAGLPTIDGGDNSVYTGTAGIALLYWKLSRNPASSDADRRSFAAKSLDLIRAALDRRKGRRVTFACGDGGPLALGAVLYAENGREDKSGKYVAELYGLSSKVIGDDEDMPDEFLYGRVGYLFALLFVFEHLGASTLNLQVVNDVVDAVLRSGRRLAAREKSASPLMFQWHDRHYLGAAHGISGICAVLLQAVLLLPEDAGLKSKIEKYVKPTLDYVVDVRFPSGNFPSSLESGEKDKLLHWCHGAPGVVYALIFAHKVFGGEEKYSRLALDCGRVIWQRGILRKGYGICHGVAGNAYAFAALFRVTGDPKHAYRASMFAKWTFDHGKHGCRDADRPYSLFEGLAGTLYFLDDARDIGAARFPAFDLT